MTEPPSRPANWSSMALVWRRLSLVVLGSLELAPWSVFGTKAIGDWSQIHQRLRSVNNFMLGEHTVHSVEFEAPLSSDGAAQRHFSIDLSLELERQLDMETFPPTPTHPNPPGAADVSNRESLDPHVLAHIIKQLQQSLAEVTKDRDELRQLIASAHSNEAELQDALQHMIDKATTMEMELTDSRKKIKDDEEAITLLRSKVEESRCVGIPSSIAFYISRSIIP